MKNSCIFLLAGDEEFLKEEWLQNTRQAFLKEEKDGGIDCSVFFADETNLPNILAIARTKPFLAKRRLIILKNLEKIASTPHQQQLLAYAKSPSRDTALILETNLKEKGFYGDKFLSEIGRYSQVLLFKRMYDKELANWISKRFLIRKKKATPQAIELLKELKGNNLSVLDKEIEKLALYRADSALITAQDAEELVGKDVTGNIYDMLDAISQNDKRKAMALSLNFQKKDLGDVIGLFCWNLRKLLKVREYLKEGWPSQKIGDALELKKFQLDRFIVQAKNITIPWIKLALTELAELDLKVKTSSFAGDAGFGWNVLIIKLLSLL